MQKPISRLLELCASLEDACKAAGKQGDMSDLLALPRVRLMALQNAIDNITLNSAKLFSVMAFHTKAQKTSARLIFRFAMCSERQFGRPVSHREALALLDEVLAALPCLVAAIKEFDGACSELAEMFH
ncbi:hypothetical protein QCE73_08895 [Caballeronia sp. LZ029]|uniref:hypothetical protein n=1 Tax=Caballeronia sp. LZ029 TaxID=3038564 RepID=UPI00286506C8|nr:hypothetical protein [Caballeronia sp. LZ029]MDR5743270.1 hypothetical protein [Caballeronia sp. LZ029]